MSEYRDYVSQNLDSGAMHISADVISSIVASSVAELEGMGGASGILKKGMVRSVAVSFEEDGSLVIDCEIYSTIERSIPETAKCVQESAASAVESVTGLKVARVNVAVTGILLPKNNGK